MKDLSRRGFLSGIIAACAAPAIIRTPGLIMPIKPALVAQTTSLLLVANQAPDGRFYTAFIHPDIAQDLNDRGADMFRYIESEYLRPFSQ